MSFLAAAVVRLRRAFRRRAWLGGLVLAVSLPTAAQDRFEPNADSPALPPGLVSVWRVDGRMAGTRVSVWSFAAFSADGKLVGVSDEGGTRIYRASDGTLVRRFPAPRSTGQSTFSLAISATGLVAIGNVGEIDVHRLDGADEPLKFYCNDVCGPVSALAFAPNGTWLAFQAVRGGREPGFVTVVDLHTRTRVAHLEASPTRTGVMFESDGRTLVAANVTRIDDRGSFGVRAWDGAADWRRSRDVPGAMMPRGSVGPFAFDERAAVYSRDGLIELRDLASGSLLWAADLVPPGLDTPAAAPMKLDLVALARRADLVLSYESPRDGERAGALVLRRLGDGGTVAMYDVAGVSALAVAPDGGSFVYTTGVGRTYTALARVPR